MQDRPKFFGRRKGRTIRKAKSYLLDNFLPLIRIEPKTKTDITSCFTEKKDKYCLEIGFGDGEHLAALSQDFPQ